jgi:hypothetical protein
MIPRPDTFTIAYAVGDVEADRPVRGQPQAGLVGLGDIDIERECATRQATLDAHPVTGAQPIALPVDHREVDRRPARDRSGLGEEVEHLLGCARHSCVSGPAGHGQTLSHAGASGP